MTNESVINDIRIEFEKVLKSDVTTEVKIDKMLDIALLYEQKRNELKVINKKELDRKKASEYFQNYKKKNLEKIRENSRLRYLRIKEAKK